MTSKVSTEHDFAETHEGFKRCRRRGHRELFLGGEPANGPCCGLKFKEPTQTDSSFTHLLRRLEEYVDALRFHGCSTGDCPHEKQTECNAELDSFAAQVRSELAAPAPTAYDPDWQVQFDRHDGDKFKLLVPREKWGSFGAIDLIIAMDRVFRGEKAPSDNDSKHNPEGTCHASCAPKVSIKPELWARAWNLLTWIESACGTSDAAQGCRNILKRIAEFKESFSDSTPAVTQEPPLGYHVGFLRTLCDSYREAKKEKVAIRKIAPAIDALCKALGMEGIANYPGGEVTRPANQGSKDGG